MLASPQDTVPHPLACFADELLRLLNNGHEWLQHADETDFGLDDVAGDGKVPAARTDHLPQLMASNLVQAQTTCSSMCAATRVNTACW
jgi:hypothetical protein